MKENSKEIMEYLISSIGDMKNDIESAESMSRADLKGMYGAIKFLRLVLGSVGDRRIERNFNTAICTIVKSINDDLVKDGEYPSRIRIFTKVKDMNIISDYQTFGVDACNLIDPNKKVYIASNGKEREIAVGVDKSAPGVDKSAPVGTSLKKIDTAPARQIYGAADKTARIMRSMSNIDLTCSILETWPSDTMSAMDVLEVTQMISLSFGRKDTTLSKVMRSISLSKRRGIIVRISPSLGNDKRAADIAIVNKEAYLVSDDVKEVVDKIILEVVQ